MRTTNQRLHGTTLLPMSQDITRPSDILMGSATPARGVWRWRRSLLIALGTAAALAVLLGVGGLL
jgi:hypothetical protein